MTKQPRNKAQSLKSDQKSKKYLKSKWKYKFSYGFWALLGACVEIFGIQCSWNLCGRGPGTFRILWLKPVIDILALYFLKREAKQHVNAERTPQPYPHASPPLLPFPRHTLLSTHVWIKICLSMCVRFGSRANRFAKPQLNLTKTNTTWNTNKNTLFA